jgi:hypothetical protein
MEVLDAEFEDSIGNANLPANETTPAMRSFFYPGEPMTGASLPAS